MEDSRACAGCRPHRLPCLHAHRGKASERGRARRRNRWQTREAVTARQSVSILRAEATACHKRRFAWGRQTHA